MNLFLIDSKHSTLQPQELNRREDVQIVSSNEGRHSYKGINNSL